MLTSFSFEPLLLAFITALLVVVISTPSVIKVSFLKNLVDIPDSERKLHIRSIPTLGGILIFAATLFAATLWFPVDALKEAGQLEIAVRESKYIISTLLILFFVGIKDDIIGTSPIKKLIAHLIVAFILVLMGDIRIANMKGIFGIYDLPFWASVLLSIFSYTVIVNSINLIDGIDGLAGSVGFLVSLSFGIWFYAVGSLSMSVLAFALAGALFGFLIYNFSPAKIFMGDSGSLTVGLILSVLSIRLIEFDASKIPVSILHVSKPVFVLSCLSYPLIDTLRVFIVRISKGMSPLSADRNHIHHRLQDIGLNHRQITLFVCLYTLINIVCSLFMYVNPSLSFIIMAVIAIGLAQIPFFFKKKRMNNQAIQILQSIEKKMKAAEKISLN